jgi:hypothetical protein
MDRIGRYLRLIAGKIVNKSGQGFFLDLILGMPERSSEGLSSAPWAQAGSPVLISKAWWSL